LAWNKAKTGVCGRRRLSVAFANYFDDRRMINQTVPGRRDYERVRENHAGGDGEPSNLVYGPHRAIFFAMNGSFTAELLTHSANDKFRFWREARDPQAF
jgi:hypothetical protein